MLALLCFLQGDGRKEGNNSAVHDQPPSPFVERSLLWVLACIDVPLCGVPVGTCPTWHLTDLQCNPAERLARLDSVRDNKLRQLEQFHRGITAFTHWVADNKARFRGEVYGPILLEVTVKDPQNAKYLEQQLPRESLTHSKTYSGPQTDLLCCRIGMTGHLVMRMPNKVCKLCEGRVGYSRISCCLSCHA